MLAFIKISSIFEDFFREIEAFSRIVRLFEYIISGIVEKSDVRLFPQCLRGLYKTYCRGGSWKFSSKVIIKSSMKLYAEKNASWNGPVFWNFARFSWT
jgi:hypothetical protein